MFTRYYGGIICSVNAHFEVAISHSISECQSEENGEFAIFSQNWLPSGPDRSFAPKTLSFGEKIVKIG